MSLATVLAVALAVMPASPHGSAGCAGVPRNVSDESVAEAIDRTPNLSTLADALSVTDLHDVLDKAADATVFAPADDALTAAPDADVLRYHVVPERLAPDRLPGTHPTLHGGRLEVIRRSASFRVNGEARLICTRMQAANGNVYLIDAVLTPR